MKFNRIKSLSLCISLSLSLCLSVSFLSLTLSPTTLNPIHIVLYNLCFIASPNTL